MKPEDAREVRGTQLFAVGAVVALLMQFAVPSHAAAQHRRMDSLPRVVVDGSAVQQESRAPAWRPLRVAKWSAAALAAGSALYGLTENRRGDDLYTSIEQVCVDEPARCLDRRPDGSYADAELEDRYRRVRDHDRRAQAALLTGQVSVAVSAALFILDLRNAGPPRTVPYDPDTGLELLRAGDGGVAVRYTLRTGTR